MRPTSDSGRQAGEEPQSYGLRGVYVPRGMTADEIMIGAEVLERAFDVEPYTSRSMVRAVLAAIRSGTTRGESYGRHGISSIE